MQLCKYIKHLVSVFRNRWKKSQALLGKSRFINYKALQSV